MGSRSSVHGPAVHCARGRGMCKARARSNRRRPCHEQLESLQDADARTCMYLTSATRTPPPPPRPCPRLPRVYQLHVSTVRTGPSVCRTRLRFRSLASQGRKPTAPPLCARSVARTRSQLTLGAAERRSLRLILDIKQLRRCNQAADLCGCCGGAALRQKPVHGKVPGEMAAGHRPRLRQVPRRCWLRLCVCG